MVDRGANGGLARSDVRILSRSSRECTVTGIDSHELQGLDVVQCAALVETNHGIVNLIMNEYACYGKGVVEFWGLPPRILFFNTSTGWFGRFVLSTEWSRTRKLDYNDLNWPRCSAWITESLALTDGGFCQKQTLYISDYVQIVSL